MNKVILLGNLGSDPEIINSPSVKIAKFSLATSDNWKDKQGQKQSRTEWHRCVIFGNLSDVVEKYLNKGDQVLVEGSVTYSQYELEDGSVRYSTDIKVQQLKMLGGSGDKKRSEPPKDAAPPLATPLQSSEMDELDDLPF